MVFYFPTKLQNFCDFFTDWIDEDVLITCGVLPDRPPQIAFEQMAKKRKEFTNAGTELKCGFFQRALIRDIENEHVPFEYFGKTKVICDATICHIKTTATWIKIVCDVSLFKKVVDSLFQYL